MNPHPVQLSLRLDWSEMDLFGHINNVSYFKYMQASRVNYWEHAGFDKMHKEMAVGPILLSTSCRFIKPLFYPGNITVQATVRFMKNTSFGITHSILNDAGEVVAEGEDVIVVFDFKNNIKTNIPDELRSKIIAIEGKTY